MLLNAGWNHTYEENFSESRIVVRKRNGAHSRTGREWLGRTERRDKIKYIVGFQGTLRSKT